MSHPIEVVAPDQMGLGESFRVTDIKVRSGASVSLGDIIAILESDEAVMEIESYDEGVIEWVVSPDETVERGQLLANLVCSEPPSGCSVYVSFDAEQTAALDSARGSLSRRDYLASLLPKSDRANKSEHSNR